MDLQERCLRYCEHIRTLTGVHTALLDVPGTRFISQPFRGLCHVKNKACEACCTHLFGAYEAERWDGKYIYYCPCGLTFVAVTPLFLREPIEYCLITGPIVMSNEEEAYEDILLDRATLSGVPRMTSAQVRALSELLVAAMASFSIELLPPDVDSGNQAAFLQMVYSRTVEEHSPDYPIETERKFQEYIRTGDKSAAQALLNELLSYIYVCTCSDIPQIKAQIQELLVLMSRAAIDGGADVDEILNLCRKYIHEVEDIDNIEFLNHWISAILHKFISFVFDFRNIKHQNLIFKTNAYIKEHLAERITLDSAAEQVYLSKSYFCKIIKEELGCTFTEYVNRIRVEQSMALLKSTGMSIVEVANAVGFDDQSYYTRIFKKQVGITPGRYREKSAL